MPSTKRKHTVDHDAVTTGRAKIRREHGPATVDAWSHKDVLLFLNNLPPDASQKYDQGAFQKAVDAAVIEAVDKNMGPCAVMDLKNYTKDHGMVFGNRAAGDLMSNLLGLVDDDGAELLGGMRMAVDGAKDRARQAEDALGYLQGIIPMDAQHTLAHTLSDLVTPLHDAGWVYSVLWNAAFLWMDTRVRSMRTYLRHVGNVPQEPPSLQGRLRMINTRIHGGNLRVDALMCKMRIGRDRHEDGNYDVYIDEAFKRTYEMSVDDGYWLAKHGDQIAYNVDWGFIVGLIDKYVACRDIVAEWKTKPLNYIAAHAAFQRFTAHITYLITSAKTNTNWSASAADINIYNQCTRDIVGFCSQWRQGNTQLWTLFYAVLPHWAQTAYLRDVPTPQERAISKPNGARITLRPQTRIHYPR
ncbi:hypothetical protein VMCG_00568 [Cytospora schulzeri]|uniref:Uncharacterized protein n=1 Tax=Cytospora schulzeri TaxID=448051 RepID=A0A423XA53_9PEZI|nr:hypothetical protein VMCG_00568 [Valsa malicola]